MSTKRRKGYHYAVVNQRGETVATYQTYHGAFMSMEEFGYRGTVVSRDGPDPARQKKGETQ